MSGIQLVEMVSSEVSFFVLHMTALFLPHHMVVPVLHAHPLVFLPLMVRTPAIPE